MTIEIRKSAERGSVDHGWLQSQHSFSFGSYFNPAQMGFSVLRVINEDRIEGGTGFDPHSHKDMEILSYVVEGALEHKDSMGTQTQIVPGEIQRMSAGTGVSHSEYNALKDQRTHFLQIWIKPESNGIPPSYAQKSFAPSFASHDLVLVASKSGRHGSIMIHQDVDIYACKSQLSGERRLEISKTRRLWVQIIQGQVEIEKQKLGPGDGAAIEDVEAVDLKWENGSEFLLFDLP